MLFRSVTNDLPSVLALLGTWSSGATVVSLPPAPRRAGGWHARQFGQVLDRMGCRFLVAGDDPVSGTPGNTGLRRVSKLALAEPHSGRVERPEAAAPAIALVQFTSGSIGAPKGVAISTSALTGHLATIIAELRFDAETDRIASWLPLYHDMGLIVMFLQGLAARADQVLARPSTFASQPAS